MRRLRRLNSDGDTIVEVLIVLAVLSLSFAIAYSTANTGLRKAQNAQEHSQALGYMNSQVELLRNAIAKQNNAVFTPTTFCVDETKAPADTTAVVLITTTPYPAQCRKHTDGRYSLSIRYIEDASNPGNSYFKFNVKWDGLGNVGQQQKNFTYKMESLTSGGAGGGGGSLYAGGAIGYGGGGGGGFYDNVPPPAPPPPPPPPTGIDWLILGSDYRTCDNDLVHNPGPPADSFNGCFTRGTSVYAYRDVILTYRTTDGTVSGTLLTGQTATLTIKYQQLYDSTRRDGTPASEGLPPSGYSYSVNVKENRTPGRLLPIDLGTFNLPIENTTASRNEHTFTTTINIPANGGSVFYFNWTNNNVTGGDPNLQINSIRITQ